MKRHLMKTRRTKRPVVRVFGGVSSDLTPFINFARSFKAMLDSMEVIDFDPPSNVIPFPTGNVIPFRKR